MDIDKELSHLRLVKAASRQLRTISTLQKNSLLLVLAKSLWQREQEILQANHKDLEAYRKNPSFQPAFADRLELTSRRLKQMAQSLNEVALLEDPVGRVETKKTLANGLCLEEVRAPLGVIFMIFESRPNVITESFSLAFKSGNALLMKGGKESFYSSQVLGQIIQEALECQALPKEIFSIFTGASRETTDFLLKQNHWIDVLIPRGGDQLIEYVSEHSKIPMIKNDRGLCHVYVHEEAKIEMAVSIVLNAKVQRPGVCNSMETLLVDRKIASSLFQKLFPLTKSEKVCWVVDSLAAEVLRSAGLFGSGTESLIEIAMEQSWDTEYLDLKMNVKIVDGLEQALLHIEKHGSGHSEVIVTENEEVAEGFLTKVDAAVTYWNASTRFTDGGELGMGAEIGISTQKLHVRGPVGLNALTCLRWIARGKGNVRS